MARTGAREQAPDAWAAADSAFEEYLSRDRLIELCGTDALESVQRLEAIVNTRENSLGNVGDHMPALRELKLTSSFLVSVRDLGTSLRHVQVLWLGCCGLRDLDGIGALSSLRELFASFNCIASLAPLARLDALRVLDLEGNLVAEPGELGALAMVPSLRELSLAGNPIAAARGYRALVAAALGGLVSLDDARLGGEQPELQERPRGACGAAEDPVAGAASERRDDECDALAAELAAAQAELALVSRSLSLSAYIGAGSDAGPPPAGLVTLDADELALLEGIARNRHGSGDASAALLRPETSAGVLQRAGAAGGFARPSTAAGKRPLSRAAAAAYVSDSGGWDMGPASASALALSSRAPAVVHARDAASELTHGHAAPLAGTAAMALRARRRSVDRPAAALARPMTSAGEMRPRLARRMPNHAAPVEHVPVVLDGHAGPLGVEHVVPDGPMSHASEDAELAAAGRAALYEISRATQRMVLEETSGVRTPSPPSPTSPRRRAGQPQKIVLSANGRERRTVARAAFACEVAQAHVPMADDSPPSAGSSRPSTSASSASSELSAEPASGLVGPNAVRLPRIAPEPRGARV